MTEARLGTAARARPRLRLGLFPGLTLGLGAVLLIAIGAGRFEVGWLRILEILWTRALDPRGSPEAMDARIVELVRLPRVLLAALCGAGLAVGGAALQGVFRNPLVSPQILGISQGGAFGGALAILLGLHGVVLLGLSFGFGLLALVLVGLLARVDGRTEVLTVILSGMIVGAFFAALVSMLQFVADPNSSLPAIVYWLMGSFSTATWRGWGLPRRGWRWGSSSSGHCATGSTGSPSTMPRHIASACAPSANAG